MPSPLGGHLLPQPSSSHSHQGSRRDRANGRRSWLARGRSRFYRRPHVAGRRRDSAPTPDEDPARRCGLPAGGAVARAQQIHGEKCGLGVLGVVEKGPLVQEIHIEIVWTEQGAHQGALPGLPGPEEEPALRGRRLEGTPVHRSRNVRTSWSDSDLELGRHDRPPAVGLQPPFVSFHATRKACADPTTGPQRHIKGAPRWHGVESGFL